LTLFNPSTIRPVEEKIAVKTGARDRIRKREMGEFSSAI